MTILRWLFVYLPIRFTVPLLGLLAWFLFYLWPWLLDLFFATDSGHDVRDTVRQAVVDWFVPVRTIEALNLMDAAKAAGTLGLLAIGLLAIYNVAAIWYQIIRRWSPDRVLIATLLLNVFIYSYPWVFAPKDWSEARWSPIPYYIGYGWASGIDRYGILWFMPSAAMVVTLVHELFRRRKRLEPQAVTIQEGGGDLPPVVNPSFAQLRNSTDLRIGLILSGGGAKGVYQAGAMRAIYEFLKQYDSLGNVKMIAGTSIGSWNSLFWLSNMIEAQPGKRSEHEDWWQSVNVARIIEFDHYLPFRQNSMLRPKPWRENFDELFKTRLQPVLDDPHAAHFYLTRSNVAQGRLEFSTNWTPRERERALRSDDIQIDSFTETRNLESIKDAVFASMDLPPLFPYQKIGYEYFEDGGVIDNLPIRFGTLVEECDLLFVLALNASFEVTPGHRSLIERLARVTDVRQGVLERNSMRMAYMYNHINHLHGGKSSEAAKSRKIVRVFAIAPEQPLAVNTSEFWKSEEFGQAFHTMYHGTRVELSRFDFGLLPAVSSDDRKGWLRMALVSPAGEINYNYRF